MLYLVHEMQRVWLAPWVYGAEAAAKAYSDPGSWLSQLPGAARASAGYELIHRIGKAYEKPEFGIKTVEAHGHDRADRRVHRAGQALLPPAPLQALLDDPAGGGPEGRSVVLVVAPLSGHHSTLLRDTVRTLLQDHKVYITDWIDARMVPAEAGAFTSTTTSTTSANSSATSAPSAARDQRLPADRAGAGGGVADGDAGERRAAQLTLMGGPIDTRRSPTQVNNLATTKPLSWFENNVIHEVPRTIPATAARSIRASCSTPASSR
jgi:poly(3-hydroxybutyrate) depolymerase